MKPILGITILAICGLLLWRRDHIQRLDFDQANRHILEQIDISEAERLRVHSSNEEKRSRIEDLRREVDLEKDRRKTKPAKNPSDLAKVMVPARPDIARRGGWSKDQGFFYFPKELLGQVDYHPVENRRITDESAALFGMSEKERADADAAIQRLFDGFRKLELAQMRAVTAPDSWTTSSLGTSVERTVAFEIPKLADEADKLAQSFKSDLVNTLGGSRARSFQEAVDAYTLDQLDDLGREERRIGFVWAGESDGQVSLWYANGDNFQRVPKNVPADSQIAYYASLFGVQLPNSTSSPN